jgi:hypothetical protein
MGIGLESCCGGGVDVATAQVDAGPLAPLIPATPNDAPFADMTLSDVRDIGGDLDVEDVAIDKLDRISSTLTEIRNDVIQNVGNNGALSAVSAEAYSLAVDHVLRDTGLKAVFVSAEAFDRMSEAATTISVEAIGESLRKVVERIIELVLAGVEKITEYVERYVSAAGSAQRRQEDLLEAIGRTGGRSSQTNAVAIQNAQISWLGDDAGNVDLLKVSAAYTAVSTEIYQQYIREIPKYIGWIAGVVSNWVQNPSEFNGERPFGDIRPPYLSKLNPKTLIKEDWQFGEWRIAYDNSDPLPIIEWIAIEHDDSKPDVENVSVGVMPLQAMGGVVQSAQAAVATIANSKAASDEVNRAYKAFGDVVAKVKDLAESDDPKAKAIGDMMMPIVNSVRSFATFPARSAGKLLHVNTAICDVLDEMLTAYNKPEAKEES